jgi:hypothetical protein
MIDDLLEFPDDDKQLSMSLSNDVDVNSLIEYAKELFLEENPGELTLVDDLSPKQLAFMSKVLAGDSILVAKLALEVSGLEMVLWRRSALFVACLYINK